MYTILIDEAGDVGLKDVKPDPSYGPTQYFCACATILDEDNRAQIEDTLGSLPFFDEILHASRLGHFEKILLARTISRLPVGMFGLVSNKLSLLEYLPDASRTPTHFYNKCLQYLLERVGYALGKLGIPASDVRIRLEARAQKYSSLLSFIDSIQRNPLDHRSIALRNVDRFSITAVKKTDDACMPISDFGAHALFTAVRRDARAFGLSEARYLYECRDRFLAGKDGSIIGHGIKAIHSLQDLALPGETAAFFRELKNSKHEYWKL
jgi:hypothetical protein